MLDRPEFSKTLVTFETTQLEYLRRAAFARHTRVSILVRELVDEAIRNDRWPEVHGVRR